MSTTRKDGRSPTPDDTERRGLRRRVRGTSPSMIVALLALVLAAAGGAAAAIPDSPGGLIHVCYDTSDAVSDEGGADLSIIDKARNREDCDDDETELTFSQKGPKGDPGTNGTNGTNGTDGKDGVSGYEVVELTRNDVNLPIDDGFSASCPAGKRPVGGGGVVQLYSPTSFVGLGTPNYSFPNTSSWEIYVRQASVNGATTANITVRVICATVLP